MLQGTSGSDLITPLDLQRIYIETWQESMFQQRINEIRGGAGNDTITADSFGDPDNPGIWLWGQSVDLISGGPGDDLITKNTPFMADIYGGDGNDTIIAANARIYAGAGDDVIVSESYYSDEEVETQIIRAGSGDDTVIVNNGFADIRGGDGNDTFILNYDRPVMDSNGIVVNDFPRFGNVIIRDFDPETDLLRINLPASGSGNVELESIQQRDAGVRINLTLTVPPSGDGEDEGGVFRARIFLHGVTGVDDFDVENTDAATTVTFGRD
ncbi:hypothetical protein PUT78_12310 [Roseinatronobacter sp. HJB301]|uniref:Calcium-binding protein n=1 Tax=Roseinatronobacter alkalisoli TaxID=3028235 RepID=A0ABT5T9U0_9RHOB|nr:hypothetical protein [Roseinatronobacter sp. HJB301]